MLFPPPPHGIPGLKFMCTSCIICYHARSELTGLIINSYEVKWLAKVNDIGGISFEN
jgi:hypothetical protein